MEPITIIALACLVFFVGIIGWAIWMVAVRKEQEREL